MMLKLRNWQMNAQIRAVLKYQAITTLSIAIALGSIGGAHWGISAFLGGLVSLLGGAIYGVMLAKVGKGSAEAALLAMMRAESAKILLIVLLLWLVFATYEGIFGAGFIGTFIVTTLIFSLAVFMRDN